MTDKSSQILGVETYRKKLKLKGYPGYSQKMLVKKGQMSIQHIYTVVNHYQQSTRRQKQPARRTTWSSRQSDRLGSRRRRDRR